MMGGMNHPFPNPGMHPGLHPAYMNTVPPGTQAGMPPNFRKLSKIFCFSRNFYYTTLNCFLFLTRHRFNTPNPVRNVNPNYPEGTQRIGSQSEFVKNTFLRDLKNRDFIADPAHSPSSNTPPGDANGKTGGKRPRRPSRKNSQDGDTEPRKRKRKGETADGMFLRFTSK